MVRPKRLPGKLPKLLERSVSSPYFQWVALAAGIALYAFIRKFPGVQTKIPEEILETPTPSFLSVVLVLLLWGVKLIVVDRTARTPSAPKDLVYREAQYLWNYKKDGSLSGTCVYELENRSGSEIDKIPYEALAWFKQVDDNDVKFRIIYRDGDVHHRFENTGWNWEPLSDFMDWLRGRSAIDLSWAPKIVPPVGANEAILYEVEISTARSETDAFTQVGTIVGFPVRRFTNKVSLVAQAPFGYRFQLLVPEICVLNLMDGINSPEIESMIDRPKVSSDGSLLSWKLEFPIAGYRYWASFRFEKKSRPQNP